MRLKITSLRARMLALILPPVLVAIGALTFFAISNATEREHEAVDVQMRGLAADRADDVNGLVSDKLGVASTLAGMMEAFRGGDREVGNKMIGEVFDRDPDVLGTWATFVRDGFDGADAAHRNGPGSDGTGYYAPYRNRLGGEDSFVASEITPEYMEVEYWTGSARPAGRTSASRTSTTAS